MIEKPKNVHYALPKNSVVRQKAMAIMAMRLAGYDDEVIGKEIGITGKTVKHYLYLAGRNGWLPRRTGLISPQDDIEYNLAHKVVRNLEEMLDDKGNIKRRDLAALEIAKGAIFKKFGQEETVQVQQTLVAFRIEMPAGISMAIREGTTGGTPNFVEADVIETSKPRDAA